MWPWDVVDSPITKYFKVTKLTRPEPVAHVLIGKHSMLMNYLTHLRMKTLRTIH